MRKSIIAVLVALAVAPAMAGIVSYDGSVTFTSDLEASQIIALSKFQMVGQVLTGVTVNVTHSGSAVLQGDNDDPLQSTNVNGRIIRTGTVTGGGINAFANKTVQTTVVNLSADDGDLATFDSTAADGTNFGGAVSYSNHAETVFGTPLLSTYEGVGTVDFTVDVQTMVNDLQFDVPPDAWQLEVENPNFTFDVEVVYNYVPEPATMVLFGLGGLLLLRRKK